MSLLDLQYHDVNRDRGLFYKMQRPGHGRAHLRPTPRSTRPSTRRPRPPGPGCGASSSARAKERKRDYTVDWVHLKLNDQAQRTVLCKDPFRSHDERVEKLIASL